MSAIVTPDIDRVEARWNIYLECFVEVGGEDDCWPCTKWRRRTAGYSNITIDGQQYGAHRISWMVANGPIPEGMFVCHSCDNPSCVNPRHLFVDTCRGNTLDAKAKGRLASGLRQGTHTCPESRARGDRHGSRTHPEKWIRGEAASWAKLTEAQVREILARLRDGRSQAGIAREYDVHISRELEECKRRR